MRRNADLKLFAIIFEGRNGSSQLVSCLNGHPNVLCYPEVFVNKDLDQQLEILRGIKRHLDIRQLNPYAGNRRYYPLGFEEKWSTAFLSAVGFKTKLIDVRHIPIFLDALATADFSLLYLTRKNIVKAAVSYFNGLRLASRTKQWNAEKTTDILGPIAIEPKALEEYILQREHEGSLHRWFFDLYPGRKLRICYEYMLRDSTRFFSEICSFIGVSNVPANGLFLKNTSDDLHEALLNHKEIIEYFAPSPYLKYFIDDQL
jgi:hypothetical protein